MFMKTTCLLFTAENRVELGETALPEPGPGEIRIATAYSCVSPGTELRCLAGKQSGAPAFPFIPGYALAGVVEKAGPGTKLAPGTAVFCGGTQRSAQARCWGGHTGHAVVGEADAVAVPAGVGLLAASAAKLAAIAYHGVRLSRPQPHEAVAVVGLGPISRFSAHLHALAGARVVATDLSARRREQAAAAGLEVVALGPGQSLREAFAGVLPGGADIVVDATGAPPVLAFAVELARDLPWDNELREPSRLLIQGSYAGRPPLPYDEIFMRELRVLVPRDCQRRDLEAVLGLMARGRLRPEGFVADAGAPAGAGGVYSKLRDEPDALVTAAFRWGG